MSFNSLNSWECNLSHELKATSGMKVNPKPLNVRFLYFEDCPSHDEALKRLRKVMKEEGFSEEVEVISVETPEQAERLEFPGSPTILIDGRDIEPQADLQYGLTCRAYQVGEGRISPLPSEAMIRRAIKRASAEES